MISWFYSGLFWLIVFAWPLFLRETLGQPYLGMVLVLNAATALFVVEAVAFLHRGDRPPRQRPERSGVEVREALEHRKLGAHVLGLHDSSRSTGA